MYFVNFLKSTLGIILAWLLSDRMVMFIYLSSGAKQKNRENLKEMCDLQSGMASAIIQIYLKQVSTASIDFIYMYLLCYWKLFRNGIRIREYFA